MGFDKLAAQWRGKTILWHSVHAFSSLEEISQVIVVTPPDRFAWLADLGPKLNQVNGGKERSDSVAAGLTALRNEISHVAIHDGLNRITNAIKKLDPKNGALLKTVTDQANLVRAALAADAKLPPMLSESEASSKLTALFKHRAGAGNTPLGDTDRRELEYVLRNKHASDKELRNKLTCCAEQLVEK